MKAEVDQDLCISCGACVSICPEVFDWDDEQKAHAKGGGSVPSDLEETAKEAAGSCPTDAIKTL
ncbi:MAG: ferredoxin [Clostridia bacterium]|nr:ferredoxin [Clostridia bacterium]